MPWCAESDVGRYVGHAIGFHQPRWRLYPPSIQRYPDPGICQRSVVEHRLQDQQWLTARKAALLADLNEASNLGAGHDHDC